MGCWIFRSWASAPVVALATACLATAWTQAEARAADGPAQTRLWKEIDLSRWSGVFPCLGDLDGDGRIDLLLYRQGPQTTPGYLVAVNHDGKELWQLGDPSLSSHSPDGAYHEPALRGIGLVFDIDEDGRAEVVVEFWKEGGPWLCVLDGATGKVEAERPSPFDLQVRGGVRSRCHPLAMIAFLDGPAGPPSIVMKFEASGRVPTHAVALDSALKTIWHVRGEPTDVGHLPTVGDLDGDGRDEFLLGTTLIQSDGRRAWRRPALNHADCTAIFRPAGSARNAALISICNSGPAFCVDPDGKLLWEKTTDQVSHGQGIWAGNFIDEEPGDEVILLKSGHWGDFVTVRGSDGEQLAAFQHRRELKGYPDFPCVVNWLGGGLQSLWIPIDRSLVDGRGRVVAELGSSEELVRQRLRWGTTKSDVAVQAFAVDLCGDDREELILYQPYRGQSVLVFTQADSDGAEKPYVPQKNAYNIHSYF
ncbi:MAG: rhamnogalacturonan lyase family protein [Thermoguttaceae bacterium]